MKILIVNNNIKIGGVQRSLINLLKEISENNDITLMLFNDKSPWRDEIPKNVKIIKGNKFTRILGMNQSEAKKEGIITYIWRSLFVIITRIAGAKYAYNILSGMQKIKDEFDVAISYSQNASYKIFYGGNNEFVINSVKAESKISFVHCDFKGEGQNNSYNLSYYNKFDKVVCVSDSLKESFLSITKGLDNKTYTVHNFYDFNTMDKMADLYKVNKKDNVLNIFSSSRLDAEKGILRMIDIFKKIKDEGGKFFWTVLGDGSKKEEILNLVREKGLTNDMEFLGFVKNPYPYFKNSDLLLVPSYAEAAPMVYGEAIYFKTPVFTTETVSSEELVLDFNGGIVAENNDDAIYKKLKEVITDKSILSSFTFKEITNNKAIKEFYNMINS